MHVKDYPKFVEVLKYDMKIIYLCGVDLSRTLGKHNKAQHAGRQFGKRNENRVTVIHNLINHGEIKIKEAVNGFPNRRAETAMSIRVILYQVRP